MPALRPFTPNDAGDESESDPQSYEALLISALVESGQFDPAKHRVTSDDIVGWGKVWAFCRDYQERAKEAPPKHLLRMMFPEFTLTPMVNAEWAATKVLEDSKARELRVRSRNMLGALAEGDLTGAFDALEHLERPRGQTREPLDVFDSSVADAKIDIMRIEVPYPTLQRMTNGGLEAGDMMLLGARLAQGKSHVATRFAARAAEVGWNVGVMSYEMPAKQYQMRVLKQLCGPRRRLFDMLNDPDEKEQKKAIAEIRESTVGSVRIFDPSYGSISKVTMVDSICRDYDFVILDHMGLMKTSKGNRVIEDWRFFAEVSNTVREITLETMTPLLGIVQINRSGVHHGAMKAPTPDEIAGTDALGQDATIVVTMKRLSKHIAMFTAGKVREGPTGTFYARFDPEENRWDELDKQRALEISADDDAMDD